MNFLKILGGGTVKRQEEWGASCLFVSLDGVNLLIDCGTRSHNPKMPLPDIGFLEHKRIDAFLLTHAHVDHIGAAPLLSERHPEAEIYATFETSELTRFQLLDQLRTAEKFGLETIWSAEACSRFLERVKIFHFGDWFKLKGGELEFCFWPSGHIRGASSVLMKSRLSNLVVSGDLSLSGTPTVSAAEPLPKEFAGNETVLVSEATAGDLRIPKRGEEEERLVKRVSEVLGAGGNVLIPAFSIGRAQDVALILARAGIEVWLGGMAKAVMESAAFGVKFFHENIRKLDSPTEVLLRYPKPKVVIATPAMMEWGQSREFCYHWLEQERNAIFIPGYQAPGTLGEKLLHADPGESLKFEEQLPGERVLRACVEKFIFSAHADGAQLAEWIMSFNPGKVFLVHAQTGGARGLKEELVSRGYKQPVTAAYNNGLFSIQTET